MIDEETPLPAAQVRVVQIISVALMAGLLLFGVVLLAINSQNLGAAPKNGGLPLLSLMAAGLLAMSVPLGFIVAKSVESNSLPRLLEGKWQGSPPSADFVTQLLGVYQTALLVQLSLIEGPGLFGGIAFLTEGGWIGLVVLAAAVLMMAAMFPTDRRLRNWLMMQAEKIRELKG